MYISNCLILSLSAAALCVMARYHLIQSIFFIACMCVFFLVKKHEINIEFVPFLLNLLSILWRAFIAFSLIEISSNTSNEHIYRQIRLQTSYPFSIHWLFVYKRIFYHGFQSITLRHNNISRIFWDVRAQSPIDKMYFSMQKMKQNSPNIKDDPIENQLKYLRSRKLETLPCHYLNTRIFSGDFNCTREWQTLWVEWQSTLHCVTKFFSVSIINRFNCFSTIQLNLQNVRELSGIEINKQMDEKNKCQEFTMNVTQEWTGLYFQKWWIKYNLWTAPS